MRTDEPTRGAVMAVQSTDDEPELREIRIWVCALCLAGEEGECHSPGCAFWMCPGVTAEQAERIVAGDRIARGIYP